MEEYQLIHLLKTYYEKLEFLLNNYFNIFVTKFLIIIHLIINNY